MNPDCTHDSSTSSSLMRLLGRKRCPACGQSLGRQARRAATPEIVLQPKAGERWGLTTFPAFLGRSHACVRVDDPLVSRVHARIVLTPEGFRVEDMGSLNGLFVDGARVSSALLLEGTRLRLGGTELRVKLVAGIASARTCPPAEAPAALPAPPPAAPPRPRPAPPAPSGSTRGAVIGSFVLGGACALEGALIAAVLALALFGIGADDPAAMLLVVTVLGLQCLLAMGLLATAAFQTSRLWPPVHSSHA